MRRFVIVLLLVVFAICNPKAGAAERSDDTGNKPNSMAVNGPGAEQSVTQHTIVIGGVTIGYTATAGTLVVRNAKDLPYASMGYIAYIKNNVSDPSRRPITFAYNGGPGSSSIWLHMGALGPKRIVTTDAAATPPPPYKVVDNDASILERTDIVMIDPVGSGFSKAVGEAKDKDFWRAFTTLRLRFSRPSTWCRIWTSARTSGRTLM